MAEITAHFVVEHTAENEEDPWGLMLLVPDPTKEVENATWAGTSPASGVLKLTVPKTMLVDYPLTTPCTLVLTTVE